MKNYVGEQLATLARAVNHWDIMFSGLALRAALPPVVGLLSVTCMHKPFGSCVAYSSGVFKSIRVFAEDIGFFLTTQVDDIKEKL